MQYQHFSKQYQCKWIKFKARSLPQPTLRISSSNGSIGPFFKFSRICQTAGHKQECLRRQLLVSEPLFIANDIVFLWKDRKNKELYEGGWAEEAEKFAQIFGWKTINSA